MAKTDNTFDSDCEKGKENNSEKGAKKERGNELSLPDFEYTPPTPKTIPPPATSEGSGNENSTTTSGEDE